MLALTPRRLCVLVAAVLGMTVIGAECAWDFVLRRAAFLASYSGKGLFFIYIAMPLLESGWAEYKDCILFWTSGPCPTTPADPDDDRGRWERLLVQSVRPSVHPSFPCSLHVVPRSAVQNAAAQKLLRKPL